MNKLKNFIFSKKCTRFSILFSLFFFTSLFCFANTNKNLQFQSEQKTVKIGYYNANSFFEGAFEGGKKSGYGYDYISDIANYTGWNYEYVYGSWPELMEKFLNGEIDLMADVSHTKEREDFMLFPKHIMGIESSWIFTSVNNQKLSASDISTLNGAKIGVSKSSTQIEDIKKWLKENNINASIILYSSDIERQQDCINGKIDASIELDIDSVHDLKALYKISSSDFYLAVKKDRIDLLNEINEALDYIQELKPQYVLELFNKHYNNILLSKKLTKNELDFLANKKQIKIGTLKSNLPFSDQNEESQKPVGIVVDWISHLKNTLGLSEINFQYAFFSNQEELEDAILEDTVDIIFPVSAKTSNKKNQIMYSEPLMMISYNLIYTGNYDPNKINKIAVPDNQLESEFVKYYFPQAKIITCDSRNDSLNLILSKQADSAILNTYKTNKYLSNYKKFETLKYSQLQENTFAQFAVNRKNKDLLMILNRGIYLIPQTVTFGFISKNASQDSISSLEDIYWNYKNLFFGITYFFIFSTIIILILLYNRKQLQIANIKAEAANKAKSSFLLNISHDIRTPMNAIIGYTNMAKKYIDNKQKVSEYLNKAQISSEHLLSLISDVLDMSKIENESITIEESPENIIDSQKEIIDIVKQSAANKHINLKYNFTSILNPNIYMDKLHVNRIALNILSNAIKYTKEGGTVSYSIEQLEKTNENSASFIFTVQDTGIGMSEDFISHIFEAFERESSSISSKIPGSGLGMAITKNLIDLMKGKIVIHSELGKGTTVIYQLAFRLQSEHNTYKQKTIQDTSIFSKKRVLLVEDNPSNREITRDMLESIGFTVDEANDGAICVDKIKEHSPGFFDYILMDIQMPYMDGYQATEIIRNLPEKEKANIPIICMTANVFSEDKEKVIKCGMNAHISKPINIDTLLQTLANC